MAIINGTIAGDSLRGGIEADLMDGGSGDDTLTGGAANDLMEGGSGNDLMNGESGADTMRGGTGDDYMNVSSAGDVVVEFAGEGWDKVRVTLLAAYVLPAHVEEMRFVGSTGFAGTGNAEANWITGGDGPDTLFGQEGADTLLGGAGGDSLEGGTGADLLNGHAGADTMRGGTGNDFYNLDDAGDLVIETGTDPRDAVRVTLLGSYTLPDAVERLDFAGATPFAGTGNTLANLISGGSGDDELLGLGGNDTLDGAAGADTLRGGTGLDRYNVDDPGDVVVELPGEGIDTIRLSGLAAYVLPAEVERLTILGALGVAATGNAAANEVSGGAGADTVAGLGGEDTLRGGGGADSLSGGDGRDALFGDGGDDTLLGGDGPGSLRGGTGADSLLGGSSADRLDGGEGADMMRGGTANDTYVVDDPEDEVLEEAGAGNDWVVVEGLTAYVLPEHVENLRAGGAAGVAGTGNAANNQLAGGIGDDWMRGLGGRDQLYGGAGDDTLEGGDEDDFISGEDFPGLAGDDLLKGGAGNDALVGYDGADTLMGGTGRDVAFGGMGADLFRFDPEAEAPGAAAALVVADFVKGQDHVLLPVPAASAGTLVVASSPTGVSISGSFAGGGTWRVDISGFDIAGFPGSVLPDLVLGVDLLWS